ncbi:hypothetical protein ACH4LN_06270 [Streptomyces albus]|uniref:Uncharacterized protein n=1 Tax=Streptomyces albus TaxID=1888 RepID=A0A6C1CE50_9ACTN|nr:MULTISPECIES: hypothetical protein [Streptomyces]EPD91156.1 hypothetical protein HMPREF1486_05088 [Streptomyces sp. HPH0547]QID40627.1 hypothetical protein G3260_003696 [Streptomyces albus]TGG81593.1 hypothetical protein D8771_19535 [Streptomyces albus]UVN55755.1 hypothetical protein NR995_15400 [Streptomyces albus]GHJ21550.1 hypothetical protein TPA0909_31640 [Streptomyces albus]
MRGIKRAAIVGAGLIAFSGVAAGAAQALPDPHAYMVGDTYKEPSKEACEKDGNTWWGVNEFSCLGPNADGSWTFRIDSLSQCPGPPSLRSASASDGYSVKGC